MAKSKNKNTGSKKLKCMFCNDVALVPSYTISRCCSRCYNAGKYNLYCLEKENNKDRDKDEDK